MLTRLHITIATYSIIFLVCATPLVVRADGPDWWQARQVVSRLAVDDYAPLLAGQLKWLATNAYCEMEEHLPGGAGSSVELCLSSWLPDDSNYSVVNVGQLKNLAALYYERLISEKYTNAYPWPAGNASGHDDYAIANIGQAKNLFSFDLTKDADHDQLPDWWEIGRFGDLSQSGEDDFDGDGISNSDEREHGSDPSDVSSGDVDRDGLSDWWEVVHGLDPDTASDASTDLAHDGITSLQKYQLDLDPWQAVTRETFVPEEFRILTPWRGF